MNSTSRTQRDTDDFDDAERGGDVGERAAVGPHPARLFLFLDLAAVTHVGRLTERVFDEQSLIARWA